MDNTDADPEDQDGDLPEATGRDNKYYQYFVTIKPDPGVDGNLVVSVKQFSDNVLPIGKEYLPLTPEQRRAVTAAVATDARDARVANETLTVRVSTGADTSAAAVAEAAAKAAYDARQVIYDANPSLKVLDAKKIIPANGYLVLGDAGVEDPKANAVDKKTAAQKLYNKSRAWIAVPGKRPG